MARIGVDQRKRAIIRAAAILSCDIGLYQWTSTDVASKSQCTPSLVRHYFTMEELRIAVVDYAIEHKILSILAEAILMRTSVDIPDHLKQQALVYVSTPTTTHGA